MHYQPIERAPGAFQEPLSVEAIKRISARAFGATSRVESVAELPWGSYNSAYRIDLASADTVVLRVAPAPERQFRVERSLLRNEYTAAPHLAPLGDLLPRSLFADFTRQVINRDYLMQTLLPGVPAPEGMRRYERSQWSAFFRQVGGVTRKLHEVRGPGFGFVAGPWFETWSAALIDYFRTAAGDIADAGQDAYDVHELAATTERLRGELDEITEPRLLHGDGWTANFLVDPATPDLTLTGICDWDRARWGDPMADWAIQRALLRPGSERDTFWDGYGQPRTVASGVRQLIYQARFLVELRLDYIRNAMADEIASSYDDVGHILGRLRSS
ncbi:MAG: phosphotransferase family protein [Mycobacteriales bacterium]